MSKVIVSVTDRLETAKVLDLYIRTTMADFVDSYFMTYNGALLNGTLIRQADLFIVELFATDIAGPYTEGIHAAAKWISLGKRTLIISGNAYSDNVDSLLYWDLAAPDKLESRIRSAITSSLPNLDLLYPIKTQFEKYFRKAIDPHLY